MTGTVDLGGANLVVSLTNGSYTPANGDNFIIVNNDGNEAVTGTFKVDGNTIANGGEFVAGGNTFVINYAGGTDNNDVVLTVHNVIAPVNNVPSGTPNVSEDVQTAIHGISVTDTDLASATVSVLHGKLEVTAASAATVTGNNSALVTITGTTSQINATLDTLKYISDLNFNGTDTLQVLSTDLENLSDLDVVAIVVSPVNDAPKIVTPANSSVAEEEILTFAGTISVSDVDIDESANGVLSVTLSANSGVITLSGVSGLTNVMGNGTSSVSFDGSVAAINLALDGLTYLGNLDFNGSDSLLIGISDNGNTGSGGAKTGFANVALTVTAVNDTPVITSANTSNVAENTTAVLTLIATDIDNDSITWSIDSGLDGGLFTIVSGNRLQFIAPPDFETSPGPFQLTVRATDNGSPSLSSTQLITVTVTDVNEFLTLFGTAGNDTIVATVTSTSIDVQINAGPVTSYPLSMSFTIDGNAGTDLLQIAGNTLQTIWVTLEPIAPVPRFLVTVIRSSH